MIISSFLYTDNTSPNGVYDLSFAKNKHPHEMYEHFTNLKMEIIVDSTIYDVNYNYITNVKDKILKFYIYIPVDIMSRTIYKYTLCDFKENVSMVDMSTISESNIYVSIPMDSTNTINGDTTSNYVSYNFIDYNIYSYKLLNELLFTYSDSTILRSDIKLKIDSSTYTPLIENIIVGSAEWLAYNLSITDTTNTFYTLYIDTTGTMDKYVNFSEFNYSPIINNVTLLKLYNDNNYNWYIQNSSDCSVTKNFTINSRKYMDLYNKYNYIDKNCSIDMHNFIPGDSTILYKSMFSSTGFFNDIDGKLYCILTYTNNIETITEFMTLIYDGSIYTKLNTLYIPINLQRGQFGDMVSTATTTSYTYNLYDSGLLEIVHIESGECTYITDVTYIKLIPETEYFIYTKSDNKILFHIETLHSNAITLHNTVWYKVQISDILYDSATEDITIVYVTNLKVTETGPIFTSALNIVDNTSTTPSHQAIISPPSYIKDFIKYDNRELFYFEYGNSYYNRDSILIDVDNGDVYMQRSNNYFTNKLIWNRNYISYIPLKYKDVIYLSKMNAMYKNNYNDIIVYNYKEISESFDEVQFNKNINDNFTNQYNNIYKTQDDNALVIELNSDVWLYGDNNLELVKLNGEHSRLLLNNRIINVKNKHEPIPKYKNNYYRLFDIDMDNLLVDTNIKYDGTNVDIININTNIYNIVTDNLNNIINILNGINDKQIILIAKKNQTTDQKLKFYPSEILIRKNDNIIEYSSELLNIDMNFINTNYHLKRIILLENDKDIMMYIQK